MRKLVGFLLTLALAVAPFGGAAFAHVKGEDGNKHGHFIKGAVTVDGSTITASGKVASTQTVVKGLEGKWRFSLVNQENKTVDSKVTPVSGKGNSAQATFKDVAPGVYKVVIVYNGKIRDKGQEKARDHEPLRFVKRNLMVAEKPAEEPQQPGDNGGKGDDQQPGNDDEKGDDQQPGNNDSKNGAQQPGGNDNKGTSGTITNPGSGSQQGGQLPKTATSLPLNAMIGGLLTLAGGAILFARRLVG